MLINDFYKHFLTIGVLHVNNTIPYYLKIRLYTILRSLLFIVLFCSPVISYAQSANPNDTTTTKNIQLTTYQFTQNRLLSFGTASSTYQADSSSNSLQSYQNLSELLQYQSNIFIRHYGPGSLASASIRGTSASHTQILWNGFNLQSSMNGIVDFSLVPLGIANQIVVSESAQSSLQGSGAIGGSISINQAAKFGKKQSIDYIAKVGNFGMYNQQLNLRFANQRQYLQVGVAALNAKNNFAYRNTTTLGQPLERQQNAALAQYNTYAHWAMLPNTQHHQQIDLHVWYGSNRREIPASLTTSASQAYQLDDYLRLSASWKKIKQQNSWESRIAYFNEYIHFNDAAISLTADNKAHSFFVENSLKRYLGQQKQWLLHTGLYHSIFLAETENYAQVRRQTNNALFASLRFKQKKWESTLSLRQAWVDKQIIYPVPAWGLSYQLSKKTILTGRVAGSYRIPTLNDLYWIPGGNPQLKPEQGWNTELTAIYEVLNNTNISSNNSISSKQQLLLSANLFSNHINNWIQWQPSDVGFWQANNLLSVWSRGLELGYTYQQKQRNWQLKSSTKYLLTRATNTKARFEGDAALNKQLVYIPLHQLKINGQLSYKAFSLAYYHIVVGQTFTTSDNTLNLNGYHLGQLHFSYLFNKKKIELNTQLNVNNIWNMNYQIIAFRPMPLRNVELSLHIRFTN